MLINSFLSTDCKCNCPTNNRFMLRLVIIQLKLSSKKQEVFPQLVFVRCFYPWSPIVDVMEP